MERIPYVKALRAVPGTSFVYGYTFLHPFQSISVNVSFEREDEQAQDGVVVEVSKRSPIQVADVWDEKARMDVLVESLKPECKKKGIDIGNTLLPIKDVKFCEYTGGGDFYFQTKGRVGVVQTGVSSDEDNSSPIEDGEVRSVSSVEIVTGHQDKVDKQLRANMVQAATQCFYKEQRNDNDRVSKLQALRTITTYGATFGTTTDVVVYKMVMDFETHTCRFIEKMRCYRDDANMPLCIDAALHLLMDRMKN